MPWIIWLPIRIAKAFVAIGRLVAQPALLRAMPWSYFGRVVRSHVWIAIAVGASALGVICMIGTAILPAPVHEVMYLIGIFGIAVGIISSWIRALRQRNELRGSGH